MTVRHTKLVGVGLREAAVAKVEATAAPTGCDPLLRNKFAQRIALRPAAMQFSPEVLLAWVIGLMALGACIAPWFRHGWLWFELISSTMALLVCCDALALWFARKKFAPILLLPEKVLRGREGQTIQIPLALSGSERSPSFHEVRIGIMPPAQESESAIRVIRGPQRLKLEQSNCTEEGSMQANTGRVKLWPWMSEIALLRRGV